MTQLNSDYSPIFNLLSNSLAGVLILAGGQSTRMGEPKALLTLPTGQTLLDYHVRAARQLAKPIVIADNQQGFAVGDSISHANTASPIIYIKDYHPEYQPDRQTDNQETGNQETNNQETDTPANNLPNQPKNANQPQNTNSVGPLGAILAGLQQLNAVNSNNKSSNQNKPLCVQNRWLLVVSCDSLVNATDIWQVLSGTMTIVNNVEGKPPPPAVICLSDADNLYPLLGIYRIDIAKELQIYLESGQRRVMRFIDPISQTVLMPQQWQPLSNLNTPSQFAKAVAIMQSL